MTKEYCKYIALGAISLILSAPVYAKIVKHSSINLTNKQIAAILPPGGTIIKGSAPDEFFIVGKKLGKPKVVAIRDSKKQKKLA